MWPYIELELAQVPSQDLKTYIVETMNELGDRHYTLNQSYTMLQYAHKKDIVVHCETQQKHA